MFHFCCPSSSVFAVWFRLLSRSGRLKAAGVKCRLNACLHVITTSHLRGRYTNDTLSSQLNSFKAQSFLQSVFNARSRGSLIRLGPIRVIQTCVITCKIFMKAFKFFGRIQLLSFPLGWVAVILGLFSVINAGDAVQKPLTKKVFSPGRLELLTLCVWGTRDNHYTMVTLWKVSCLSSVRWLSNMFVIDVQAVSSNSLLATTQVSFVCTSLGYQVGLVKGSRFHVRIGILSFWFFFLVLGLQFSLLDFAS